MTNRLLLSFIAAVLLSSCAERGQIPGKAFEGTITEVVQLPGLGRMLSHKGDSVSDNNDGPDLSSMLGAISNVRMKFYIRANKVAFDATVLGGLANVHTIIDRDTRTMTMLLPGNTAVVQDLRAADTMRSKIDDSINAHSNFLDSLDQLLPQPTGNHKNIEGLEAEEYKASNKNVDVDMWLSSDDRIKAFETIRDAFLGRAHTGLGGLEQVFEIMKPIGGKIPVRFETKIGGEVFAKGELKSLVEEKVPDDVFQIPAGYTVQKADSLKASHPAPPAPKRGYTAPFSK